MKEMINFCFFVPYKTHASFPKLVERASIFFSRENISIVYSPEQRDLLKIAETLCSKIDTIYKAATDEKEIVNPSPAIYSVDKDELSTKLIVDKNLNDRKPGEAHEIYNTRVWKAYRKMMKDGKDRKVAAILSEKTLCSMLGYVSGEHVDDENIYGNKRREYGTGGKSIFLLKVDNAKIGLTVINHQNVLTYHSGQQIGNGGQLIAKAMVVEMLHTLGITQTILARRMGMSNSSLSDLLNNGKIGKKGIEKIKQEFARYKENLSE